MVIQNLVVGTGGGGVNNVHYGLYKNGEFRDRSLFMWGGGGGGGNFFCFSMKEKT